MSELKIKTTEDINVELKEVLNETDEITLEAEPQMGGNIKPLDSLIRARAYEMYMDNAPWSVICKTLDLNKGTLNSWIVRYDWSSIRKQNQDDTVRENLETKKALLSGLTLEMLDNCLRSVRRAGGPDGFKPKDLPTFLSALTSLEKLSRLSLGLATSISEERSKRANFTLPMEHLKTLTQVKVNDPFAATPPPVTNDESNGSNT